MSALSGSELQALVDSVAKQLDLLEAVYGDTVTADKVLYGMQQNVERIKAYTNEDARVALEGAAAHEKDLIASLMLQVNHTLAAAIENHIRREEDMAMYQYWAQELSTRIPPAYAIMGRSIGHYYDPAYVFPPVTLMGTFAVTGADTGTFTDQNAIDLNKYGAADLEAEVTAAGGASVSLVATITGKDANGSTITGTATFSSANVGDKVNVVPTESGAQFADITNITITGGASGDAFKVQSKYDRSLSL